MDTGNRYERDPRSGTQQVPQSQRDDVGEQWSYPASKQGQGGEGLDTTDQYAQQTRYGQAGYGSDQQRSDDFGGQGRDDWGQGRAGAGRTSDLDPSSTSAQYGGSETGGYSDPSTTQSWKGQRDDDDTTGTGGGKPSTTSKVKGTAEKMIGKMTGDTGRQARGDERQEGY